MIPLEDYIDHDLSWMAADRRTLYSMIGTTLGYVYAQVRWDKVSGTKIATDVFEHRIKNSASRPTYSEFLAKLCSQLSIQALHMDAALTMEAMEYSIELLRIIRRESQLCVMLAKSAAKLIKSRRKR